MNKIITVHHLPDVIVSAVAFKKKTNKTPTKEIDKVEAIKKEYFR